MTWAKVTFQRTQAASAHARSIYLNQVPLPIDGQRTQPTIQICRDGQGGHSLKIALEPFNEPSKRKFTFIVALTCLFQLEGGLLRSMTYLHRRDSNWIAVAVLLTSGTGRNLSGLMPIAGRHLLFLPRPRRQHSAATCSTPGRHYLHQLLLLSPKGPPDPCPPDSLPRQSLCLVLSFSAGSNNGTRDGISISCCPLG